MGVVRQTDDLRVAETGELRTTHAMFVDTCMHGPNMTGQAPVTVTHLHGGKVDPISDGPPEEVFGPGQSSVVYEYPNIQPAGTLWYHDHALGITRLNVMMGLAGLYYIRDNEEVALQLPSDEYELPLVIQDKSFGQDGSILYPEKHQDHFFGDVLMVNGKVWPYLEVKRGKYRFRLINGSNSRTYSLALSNGASFYQIGSELGLIDAPLLLNELTIHPGERYDVVMDFGVYAPGTEITLTNSAPAPFPGFPGVGVVPEVMKFLVQADPGYTNALPLTLVAVPPMDTSLAVMERVFELVTIPDHGCGDDHGHGAAVMWTINGLMWDDITEFPEEDSYEIWTWHNESGMSHPMHMHLVAFQILHRQAIDESTGLPIGPLFAPEPHERGWKDTGHSPTGFRTAVMAQFSGFTGTYPYHCHILEHEDHEMMRQFTVVPANPGCTINGGVLGASENRSFCVGTGTPSTLAVTVTGASGTNARWALIDALGNIVETRSSNSLFNLDNKAPGDYTIRYLRYENDVTNLGTITNISQIGTLNGCYSVASNAITVFLRPEPLGGILTALTPTTVCANAGASTGVQLAIAGNTGEFSRFGITSPALGQQLVATSNTGSVNLNGLAPGSYTAAHLSYQRGVNASAVNFPNELRGCYAISNTLPLKLLDCSVVKLENAPNPSTGHTTVTFSLPATGKAELSLYDMNGRLIEHLFSSEVMADHEIRLDFDGSDLPDGVYLYRLTTDKQVLTDKFILSR